MKSVYILALILSLLGCATKPEPIIVPNKIAIDSYVLEKTEPQIVPTLEELDDFDKFLVVSGKNTLIYKSCVNRLTAAQAVIRRFSNNP